MANIRSARRSGFILRGGRNVRQMLWIPLATFSSNAIAVSSAVLISSLNAAALALTPFTIVRTRGQIFVASDQVANSENQAINYGHIVVSEQASAIGITAVPTPITEAGSDFHVFESLMARVQVATAVSMFEIGASKEINSKAMRKVDSGEDLIEVVETPAGGPTQGIEFRSYWRALIKLH